MLLGCGCLLAMGAAFAPRVVLILMWIFGTRISLAFSNALIPILGIIFLPYTTIMYVLVWSPVTGVVGWDWLWLGLMFVGDIMSYAGGGYRRRLPGYEGY